SAYAVCEGDDLKMKSGGTPIPWALRAWLVVEVLFGLGAIASVGLSPADTRSNFAWPIQPVVTAAVLGAFYFATAPILVLALFARVWESVRVIVLPAIAFTTVELLATFLHWDKFSVGTLPFYVWFEIGRASCRERLEIWLFGEIL